jgi:DNA-binding response OmpR family regulator
MERLLIIDDDVELCEVLSERLARDGFSLDAVHDGQKGLERARSGEYTLVIVDLMLPLVNGLDVLRRLRSESEIPVLILTARGEDVDRIVGLEIGADDYLPKPFNPRELIARIRAILRRGSRLAGSSERLAAGDVRMEIATQQAWASDRPLRLTTVEFSLLEIFLREAGRVVTREQLTERVLSRKLGAFDHVIDVHISNLRKKIGNSPDGERIKAIRGAGYMFIARPESHA